MKKTVKEESSSSSEGSEFEDGEEEEEESYESLDFEDYFHKNTRSFQCLAQRSISRSSIFRDPLYHFPEIEEIDLEQILWADAIPPVYDDIGIERYKDLCKEEEIRPFRRVLEALPNDYLDLKFFGLTLTELSVICKTLAHNAHIKHISLQENWLTPEMCTQICNMIIKNKTLLSLDLTQCNMEKEGIRCFTQCIIWTKNLTELNLSHNNLEDEGIEFIAEDLKQNTSIKKLNLSHNHLTERSLIILGPVIEDNYVIQDLDLSWNYFYTADGLIALMNGLADNISIQTLNLAWNGIGDRETIRPITAFLRLNSEPFKHLNLSYNRITGPAVRMIRMALIRNEHLQTLNISHNPLTADEVESLSRALITSKSATPSLRYINFGDSWVKKSFLPVYMEIQEKGFNADVGGVFSNYDIPEPNVKEVLINRMKFIGMSAKKKKNRKDIGQWIIRFKDESVKKEEFIEMIKKQKLKLDPDILETALVTWENPKFKVDLKAIKEDYLSFYPDTVKITKKPKKKKKKKE